MHGQMSLWGCWALQDRPTSPTLCPAPPGAPGTSLDTRNRLRGSPCLEVELRNLAPRCAGDGTLLKDSLHKVHSEDQQSGPGGSPREASACASVATWATLELDTPAPFQSHGGEAATSGVLPLGPGHVLRGAVSCWQRPVLWVRFSVSPSSPGPWAGASPGCHPPVRGQGSLRAEQWGQHPLVGEGQSPRKGSGISVPSQGNKFSSTAHPCLQS